MFAAVRGAQAEHALDAEAVSLSPPALRAEEGVVLAPSVHVSFRAPLLAASEPADWSVELILKDARELVCTAQRDEASPGV